MLCKNEGCTSTGLPAKEGFCSECYKMHSCSAEVTSEVTQQPKIEKKKKKLRCQMEGCNKKLTLIDANECRCGKVFCVLHRYAEDHNCEFEWKKHKGMLLEKSICVMVRSDSSWFKIFVVLCLVVVHVL